MPVRVRTEAAIFKRKPTYLTEIDGQINLHPLEVMQREPTFAALSEDDQKAFLHDSLVRQVMEVANEELQRHGLKLKSKIKGGGNQ